MIIQTEKCVGIGFKECLFVRFGIVLLFAIKRQGRKPSPLILKEMNRNNHVIFQLDLNYLCAHTYKQTYIERFSNECRKTKTKVTTPANHNKHKLPNEPIRTRSKYM